MSPRWFDGKDHLALDTGGGPIARLWSTALSGLVDIGLRQGHRPQRADQPAEDDAASRRPPSSGRSRSGATRHRAQPRPHLLPGVRRRAARCTSCEKALAEVRAGRTKTWETFEVPDEAISCGFTEAVRGVLSHHMVIRDGKIANYHPYPPTPWNASVRDIYGTPGPVRGRGAEHADLRGEPAGELQGHRHHARRAQLRPVPAVRRAHVPRRRARSLQTSTTPADDAGDAGDLRPTSQCRDARSDMRRSGSRRCWTQLRRRAATRRRATGPRSWSALLVELLRRRPGRIVEIVAGPSGRTARSTRWPTTVSRACSCCTTCIPTTWTPGSSARSDRVRPYLGSHAGGVELPRRRRRRASPTCGWRAAATAARPRRSRSR